MKKILLLLMLSLMGLTALQAQLPNGSIAPDFTGVDLDGNTHNLYSLLNAGKTVYIDVSATWCGPCWNYHNTNALEDIWTQYGPGGTNEAFVLFIEGDAATNEACLYGPSGCVGGTQGDWVTGTGYPIINDATIKSLLAVTFYPTIYMVCPADKKIYQPGQLPAAGLWNYRTNNCPEAIVNVTLNSITNVKCFGTNSGKIDISASSGTAPYTYAWSNGATTQDLATAVAGTYSCVVTSSNGWTGTISDLIVEGPDAALVATIEGTTPVGCNGVLGSITVSTSGGWGGYDYNWNNGSNTPTIENLTVGNYTVSITDAGGCSRTLSVNMPPPTPPSASIANAGTITCAQPTIQLNANNSSSGTAISYLWTTTNGMIVNGGTTTTPTVGAGGNYKIVVTNNDNGCTSTATVIVPNNTTPPTASAGTGGTVTCTQTSIVLEGSGSTGNNFSYLWTATNGGNISSGATTLSPTANAPGTYTLKVTNTSNGCTSTSSALVIGNNTSPSINTTNGALTCASSTVVITTSSNALNPAYAWTGPNSYTSNVQNPSVTEPGTYNLVLTDNGTGCIGSATATVTVNTALPGASASGGTLTCATTSTTVNGSSMAINPSYTWSGPNNFSSNLQNPSVNTGGTYNLIVTDPANGCTSTAAATVATNTTAPQASATASSNLNCNTTQLQLSGTGSSQGANYTYNWTTTNGNIVSGGTTLTPLVNQTGAYNILVTNTDNACTSAATVTVNQSPSVNAQIASQQNVSCNGGTNGTATAAGSGGNNSFSYVWSNGNSVAIATNLAVGVYLVTITDGENCTATTTVSITEPAILMANASTTSQTSNGVNDGTATANPSGGTAAYTYAWSTGANTQTIAGLAPGSYAVSVTDLNGCTSVQTVTVNSFDCTIAPQIAGTNASCFASNNGTAAVTIVGGSNPITYNWNTGANTSSIANLAAGTYTVSIMDANNCPATLNVSISEPNQIQANASATNESSSGANNGTATANPTGGIGTFTYAWSNGGLTQTITNLAPGTYSVIITDNNGCTGTQSVVVSSFDCAISAQNSTSNVTCAGAANGSVTVSLTGGAAPFAYNWSNGGSTATISSLAGGTYTATITDDNGCQVTTSATVAEPDPFTSWTVQSTNPACPNEATGSASVSISGATMPYGFVWNNGTTGNNINNVVAGIYSVVVTDANGCTSKTTVQLVPTDNIAPSVTAQNATLALNMNGAITVTAQSLNASATDNCQVQSVTVSPAAFDCDDLGQHVVTITATDAVGLTATTTATVTVIDNTAPTVTCPNSITQCSYDNIVTFNDPYAQDNCLLSGGTWLQLSGLPKNSEFPVGATAQTYQYTDASNNVGTCTFEVIITAPIVVNSANVVNDQNGQGVGAIDLSVNGGVAPLVYEWTLGGAVVGTTEDLSGLSQGSYAVEVTDAFGCIFVRDGFVVENSVATKEPIWLSGMSIQPNPTSGMTTIVFAQLPQESVELNVTDATGRIVVRTISDQNQNVSLDCTMLPQGIYMLRIRSGNEIGMRKLVINR